MKWKVLSELIQVAIGQREKLSRTLSEEGWAELFMSSRKQAVVGVGLLALDKLSSKGQKPPTSLLFEWIGLGEQIKARNRIVNKRCEEISGLFAESGFRNCILKGQGNAQMYPEPLLRTPGDIDIWVEGNRDDIKNFVTSRCADAQDGDLHIEFPIFKDVLVEVPKYNKRLQAWFEDQTDVQFGHRVKLTESEICVPTATFNAVQQMSHIMAHFFIEGIGLRQFVDYYYVLKRLQEEGGEGGFRKIVQTS